MRQRPVATSDAGGKSQRCPAAKKDGSPCTARAGPNGFCVGHGPNSNEARRRGGQATSRAARAGKLLPSRLRPILERLETALEQVHTGKLLPAQAGAMASLAGAIIRVYQSGELEERLQVLEERTGQSTISRSD